MNEFTIRDLENLSGIKAHTIRVWEQRYNLFQPKRSSTNIRYYNSEDLRTILNISLLTRFGFRISQINKMPRAEISDKVLSLSTPEAYQEKMLNDLVLAMISLDAYSFEDRIDQYLLSKGPEQAIKKLIFSFLERIGLLWMTSHINAAQEHLVTQVIRQKLLAAIDKIPPSKGLSNPVLMFLPEGEQHELGLIFVHYILRSQGTPVLYLGPNLPMADLAFAVQSTDPARIYAHITWLPGRKDMNAFISEFQRLLPNKKLYLSGTISGYSTRKLPENFVYLKDLNEVITALTR